jgi:hypothetical protein
VLTQSEKKAAIDAICKANNGTVTADLVIEAARNAKHVLHSCFIWDDARAAHKHRQDIARDLISSVQVFIEHEERTVTSISYCRDPRLQSDQQGYVKVSDLAKRKAEAQQALLAELDRIVAAVERGRGLALGLGCEAYFEAIFQNALQAKSRVESKSKKRAA